MAVKYNKLEWVERSWREYFDSKKEWQEASRLFWAYFHTDNKDYIWGELPKCRLSRRVKLHKYVLFLHHEHHYQQEFILDKLSTCTDYHDML